MKHGGIWSAAFALSLLATQPIIASGDGAAPLIDVLDAMPSWHSIVIDIHEDAIVRGDIVFQLPGHAPGFSKEKEPAMQGVTVFEQQGPDGDYRWFAAHTRTSSDSRASLVMSADVENVHLDVDPLGMTFNHQAAVFAYNFHASPGRFRLTTWAAAEVAGTHRHTITAPTSVSLVAMTTGTDVSIERVEDHAITNASATIANRAATAGIVAHLDHIFKNRAFIGSYGDEGPTVHKGCVCIRRGPIGSAWQNDDANTPPWGVRPIFAGPPGEYTIDALAYYGLDQTLIPAGIPTPTRPFSIRPLHLYTFADVVLPDDSNSSIPWGTITTPTGIIRNSSALFRLTPIQPGGGIVERMLGEDLAQASWAPLVPNDEAWLALSPGDGKKTVHARFRDAALTEQDATQPATLIVDSRPPVITNQNPPDGATGVLPVGLVISADWADDTSASQDVAGVDARAVILWFNPRGGLVATDHPTMMRTDTGFTFVPPDVRPGERYEIWVSKPDLAGNWVRSVWSFET